jgi:hypothetical protein
MARRKIIRIAGIAVFLYLIRLAISFSPTYMSLDFNLLYNFIDIPTFLFIFGGAAALAFAKLPKNKNEFLKYLSKTALPVCTAFAVIGFMNVIFDMTPRGIMENTVMAFNSIFYGAIICGISYALHRDEPAKITKKIVKKNKSIDSVKINDSEDSKEVDYSRFYPQ